jgi:hypothetical protein
MQNELNKEHSATTAAVNSLQHEICKVDENLSKSRTQQTVEHSTAAHQHKDDLNASLGELTNEENRLFKILRKNNKHFTVSEKVCVPPLLVTF